MSLLSPQIESNCHAYTLVKSQNGHREARSRYLRAIAAATMVLGMHSASLPPKQPPKAHRPHKIGLATLFSQALFPTHDLTPIRFVNRITGEIETEKVAGKKWLAWLYGNPVGEITLRALVKRKVVSSLYGQRMHSPSSAKKVATFVKDFDIDLSIARKQAFTSFNDFFTRELTAEARPINTNANVVVSPADGKVLAWADIRAGDFPVKGSRFDIHTFLNDAELSDRFADGSVVVARLAPSDYHRFHFPVGGSVSETTKIKGDYYSVNPIALAKMSKIFCMNKREYTVIQNERFGDVVMVEVGATMVGSIIQTATGSSVEKGAEKGYFEFGGSTVVLLFEKDKIQIDADLLENTTKGLETSVIMGERIGTARIEVES
jgi:phosphatidylserine decarboxylase